MLHQTEIDFLQDSQVLFYVISYLFVTRWHRRWRIEKKNSNVLNVLFLESFNLTSYEFQIMNFVLMLTIKWAKRFQQKKEFRKNFFVTFFYSMWTFLWIHWESQQTQWNERNLVNLGGFHIHACNDNATSPLMLPQMKNHNRFVIF